MSRVRLRRNGRPFTGPGTRAASTGPATCRARQGGAPEQGSNGMDITLIGRNVGITEQFRSYAEEKADRVAQPR